MPLIEHVDPIVILDFQDNGHDLMTANVPVRFSVGDIDFFGPAADPYGLTSVIDLAPRGWACMRILEEYHRAALEVTAYGHTMRFRRDDDEVAIYFESATVRVKYGNLSSSWLAFALKVRETVFSRHPEQISNPWWSFDASWDDWPLGILIPRITDPKWLDQDWPIF